MNFLRHLTSYCVSFHVQLWNLFVVDYLSKRWAVQSLTEPWAITPFLSFELSINRGISWGLFSSTNPYIFWGVTVAVGLFLAAFAWYASQDREKGICSFAQMLVVVGGTGNLFDRVFYGGVVDFIHVHYDAWSFPSFNSADICIVVGVFLMVVQLFLKKNAHDQPLS